MFFEDHEKRIYTPTGSDKKYDPLALDRALQLATDFRLAQLVEAWKVPDKDEGDISPEGRLRKRREACVAEAELAKAARTAFGLPDFPECTDGTALELLCDWLDYFKKKGNRGDTPPHCTTSAVPTPPGATMSS